MPDPKYDPFTDKRTVWISSIQVKGTVEDVRESPPGSEFYQYQVSYLTEHGTLRQTFPEGMLEEWNPDVELKPNEKPKINSSPLEIIDKVLLSRMGSMKPSEILKSVPTGDPTSAIAKKSRSLARSISTERRSNKGWFSSAADFEKRMSDRSPDFSWSRVSDAFSYELPQSQASDQLPEEEDASTPARP